MQVLQSFWGKYRGNFLLRATHHLYAFLGFRNDSLAYNLDILIFFMDEVKFRIAFISLSPFLPL